MLSAAALERTYSFPFLHVFAGDRLQAFSDAVFAIIATFMVSKAHAIPLSKQRANSARTSTHTHVHIHTTHTCSHDL